MHKEGRRAPGADDFRDRRETEEPWMIWLQLSRRRASQRDAVFVKLSEDSATGDYLQLVLDIFKLSTQMTERKEEVG